MVWLEPRIYHQNQNMKHCLLFDVIWIFLQTASSGLKLVRCYNLLNCYVQFIHLLCCWSYQEADRTEEMSGGWGTYQVTLVEDYRMTTLLCNQQDLIMMD